MAESKKNVVVRQAAFLMAAQMISSVIGLLYRAPLRSAMGSVGAGYYSFAYEWYTIILLIASYSIPSAVSKVMAERLALRKYKDAYRVFKAALIYVIIAGTVGGLFAYFAAPLLLRESPDAQLALRVMAPTIFLSGILGVLRGFFQAHNTMKPTAISQVAEQIMNAVFSVVMAVVLTRPFRGNEDLTGKFGAAGGTIGTGVGVATGLVFMLLAYFTNRQFINRRLLRDTESRDESYREVFKVIFMMCTPIILATCVYNLTSVVDQKIFTVLLDAKGMSAQDISRLYGRFSYNVKPLINIPIALASATSTALIPAVATSMASGRSGDAVEKIDECVKMTLLISIPSAAGLAILSYPLINVLYPSADVRESAILLSMGAVSVIFYSLSTVTNGVLQGLGKPSIPVIHAAIGLGANAAFALVTVGVLDWNVYGVLLATVLYSCVVMILNAGSVRKLTGYGHSLKQFNAPVKAALVMSAAVAAIYWIPRLLAPGIFGRYLMSAVLMAIAVLAGIIVYFIVYDKVAHLSDDELRRIPGGTRLLQVFRKLKLR